MPADVNENRIEPTVPPRDNPESTPDGIPLSGAKRALEEMQQRGLLTEFQSEQIRNGQSQRLIVGPYILLAPLGRGGMGEVFRARHHLLGREAAVKLILPDQRASQQLVRRFLREARAVAALKHPNIVSVYESGGDGDALYLAMELLPGMDLARYLTQHGPLSVVEACSALHQAALALQHAHERGLVHRDVKPHNLLRTPDGQVILLDLGLALLATAPTLTRHSALMGTADYIAPEQITAPHSVDTRADVYSLGCTLYHLLSGRTPFADALPAVRAACHLTADPPPIERYRPELSRRLVAVLRRMMARKREDRFQTPAEVAAALEPFYQGDQGPQVGDVVAGWLLEKRLDPTAALFRGVKDTQAAPLLLTPVSQPRSPVLEVLARVRHPALMEVQEQGVAVEWNRFFAVLGVDNVQSLEEYLERRGSPGWRKAAPLFLRLADGLAAVHAQGVVHGGIHPAGVLLRRDGTPLLVGFDLTGTGPRQRLLQRVTQFPRLFAAPEQVYKGQGDERSDVYSLAAVLYFTLAYHDERRREPAEFDARLVPEEVRELLTRCLDRRPEYRPEHGTAFRAALRGVVTAGS